MSLFLYISDVHNYKKEQFIPPGKAPGEPNCSTLRKLIKENDDLTTLLKRAPAKRSHFAEPGPYLSSKHNSEVAHKLMQIAVDIYDRQVQQSERWKILVPMVVALISAGVAIAAAILTAGGGN